MISEINDSASESQNSPPVSHRKLINTPNQRIPKVGDKVRLRKDWDCWPDEIEGVIDGIDSTGGRITLKDSAFVYRIDHTMPRPQFVVEFLDEQEDQYYTDA